MSPKLAVTVLVGLALGAVLGGVVHATPTAPPSLRAPLAPVELTVPARDGAIAIDGEMEDPGWPRSAGRTGAFTAADGTPAHPFSEARFAWGDGMLYVMLYAADEDIRARGDADGPLWTGDAFHLVVTTADGERQIDLSALGAVTDARRLGSGALDYAWSAGATVAADVDGTPNVSGDDDEEWVLEVALPLAALGLAEHAGARAQVSLSRCDTPRGAGRTCASWGGGATTTLVLGAR